MTLQDLMVYFPAELDLFPFSGLVITSYVASFVTVAFGVGGGSLLIALMATIMPGAALIPVRGVVQLGSNAGRMMALYRHMHGQALPGSLLGP